jgi:ABC-type sugar transport system substrate-binding protein
VISFKSTDRLFLGRFLGRCLAAASLAAALAACGNAGNGGTAPVTAPPTTTIDFMIFTNQAFSNNANTTPVSLDLTFNFDANDNPTAFDNLIAYGTFGAGS